MSAWKCFFLFSNALIVSRFGQKHLLNALNVNIECKWEAALNNECMSNLCTVIGRRWLLSNKQQQKGRWAATSPSAFSLAAPYRDWPCFIGLCKCFVYLSFVHVTSDVLTIHMWCTSSQTILVFFFLWSHSICFSLVCLVKHSFHRQTFKSHKSHPVCILQIQRL